MTKVQVLDVTSAFPPVEGLCKFLMEIDYRKHYNQFMDFIVTVCAVVAAVYVVLSEKWEEHNMTERLQIVALNVKEYSIKGYQWTKNVGLPNVIDFINEVRSGVNVVRQFA